MNRRLAPAAVLTLCAWAATVPAIHAEIKNPPSGGFEDAFRLDGIIRGSRLLRSNFLAVNSYFHPRILHHSSRTNRATATGDRVRGFASYHFPPCITLGQPF